MPNIVFILVDDLGWRDLTCYGSGFYETPNLDRLASQGMTFTDAYAACPVCSPTRASYLTGKYPARLGLTNYLSGQARGRLVEPPYVRHLPLEEQTVARALKEGGYSTWHVGKWHLGPEEFWPEQHGFDANIGGCSWGMPRQGYFSPWGCPTLPDGPEGEYLTDRLTDEAIRLIEGRDEGPFFLSLCYYSVHVPIQAKPSTIEKYRDKAKALGLDGAKTFEEGEHFPSEHKRDQRVVRRLLQSDPAYAAMVEHLDENIGRLMEALEQEGVADDTVVVFTSDNGGLATAEGSPTSNAPLCEGKGWMYEGGTREPLIVKWPGKVRPGSLCNAPVTTPDFYPTFLEMADLPLRPEQHADGASLLPFLRGGDELEREAIFWHYPHYGNQGGTPGASVRTGDFKLIEFYEDGRLELYNLREDIGEERNVAPERPEVAEEMYARLKEWRARTGAKMPTPNPEWRG